MSSPESCPHNGDNQFGPRVASSCRAFDFTLLFEDAFFVALPAALFLLLLPLRLRSLLKAPVKVSSYRLATGKLGLLAALLVFHLLFLVFRLQASRLHTTISISAGVLNIAAVVAAGLESFMEDQRSLNPSDLLVLYFSASTLLFIPQLRTLWLIPSNNVPEALWTVIFILTTVAVFAESAHKTRFLRPAYKNATEEQVTGFWGKSLYLWVLPLFRAGYSNVLQLEDIPKSDPVLREKATWPDLDASWQHARRGPNRLLRATFKANLRPILCVVAPRLALAAFTFCQPFLVGASVSYLSAGLDEEIESNTYGPALVGAFLLVYLGIAISRAMYWRQTYRMIARVRSGLTAELYRHTTTLRACDMKDSAAVTLMGTDVERIVDALAQFHELWASVLEVAIAIWLLARQLSFAAVLPIVVCIASVFGASQVASRFGKAQKTWNECVQRRIAVTISMLSDMRAVKMLGLTGVLANLVTELRVTELKASERFRMLRIWRILISNAPTTLAPFLTFAAYAGIAASKNDQSLLSAQAFTSLSLISILTNPLLIFCQALPTFFQAVSCFGRIETYLLKAPGPTHDSPSPVESPRPSTELRNLNATSRTGGTIMSFENADISWSAEGPATLSNMSLDIQRGFTAIIGPVASGKSTLLGSMIGETTLTSGFMAPQMLFGIAFCSQTPWVMNRSIRENITGGLEFDQKWYDYSLMCCELQEDIARMPGGDQSIAGSNGSSLSGGQRQRVALARAVYSRLPIVILDDVISGLDNTTASAIITRLFSKQGHFRKAGISVVIATHSKRILPHMDTLVVLENGKVAGHGAYDDVRVRLADILGKTEKFEESDTESTDSRGNGGETAEVEEPDLALPSRQEKQEAAVSQQRRYGSWPVYRYYFGSANFWTLISWAIFTLVGGFTSSFTTIWIDMWTAANEKRPNQDLGLYLGVYAMLVVMSTLGVAGECWLFFINIITQTALKMHADLLMATTHAPYNVFQKSDTGSITNRFSQDMDLIDMRLPANAIQFTTGGTTCVIQLIILCVLGKYLAAVIPILAGTLFLVQRFYLRLSRQVRLLDIEAKAPLYKQFVETEQGVSTIRAYRWTAAFHEKHGEILDQAQRPFYMLFCIQQWLELVLDLIVGALAVIIVAVATSVANSLSPGSLGVALVLVLQFNSSLTQTIQSWTRLETSIGAVFRVQQFVQQTPLEDAGNLAPVDVSKDWPPRGGVSFQNIVAHYNPDAAPALANVSLNIAPGEKVALCGSSGSGKTSLILATLRMLELSSGQITVDGTDLSSLRGEDVRSRLNIVPQEPFFMPGTVRLNLDPQRRCSDDTIEAAIRAVGLWDKIAAGKEGEGNFGGLDGELVSTEWSQGEKQLLCLARALLVPSKVVILDEATSSVDEGTEAVMQKVIDTEFHDRTVISVLHRFTYIQRFDRVAVMKHGELVECDTPQVLLGRDSAFRELYRAQHGGRQPLE